MDELLKNLAAQTGLDASTAKNALGAIIAFVKQHLPSGTFGQVESSLPGANQLVDSFEANKVAPSGAGGILGSVTGVVGKLFGGGAGSAAQLATMLGSTGLSVAQIQSFLPKALEALKTHLPADLFAKVIGLVQGAHPPAEG